MCVEQRWKIAEKCWEKYEIGGGGGEGQKETENLYTKAQVFFTMHYKTAEAAALKMPMANLIPQQ